MKWYEKAFGQFFGLREWKLLYWGNGISLEHGNEVQLMLRSMQQEKLQADEIRPKQLNWSHLLFCQVLSRVTSGKGVWVGVGSWGNFAYCQWSIVLQALLQPDAECLGAAIGASRKIWQSVYCSVLKMPQMLCTSVYVDCTAVMGYMDL